MHKRPILHHFALKSSSLCECFVENYCYAKLWMKSKCKSHKRCTVIIQRMNSTNGKWHYIVTSSPIGWAHTWNDHCRCRGLVSFVLCFHVDGLVQERHSSSALTIELLISCTNPLISSLFAESYYLFTHILQRCLDGTGAIIWLYQC